MSSIIIILFHYFCELLISSPNIKKKYGFHGWITQEDAAHNAHLIDAPIIMGNAQSCNALRRPTPSAIQPLNRDPRKAPPKHVLTTRPLYKEKIRLLLSNTNKSTKAHFITLWFFKIKITNALLPPMSFFILLSTSLGCCKIQANFYKQKRK